MLCFQTKGPLSSKTASWAHVPLIVVKCDCGRHLNRSLLEGVDKARHSVSYSYTRITRVIDPYGATQEKSVDLAGCRGEKTADIDKSVVLQT